MISKPRTAFAKKTHTIPVSKLSLEHRNTNVRRLSFRLDENNERVRIGGGFHDIYLGNLVFKDGSRKKVTIKRFNKGIEILKLDDKTAKKYQHVIDTLRKIELEHDSAFPNRQIGKSRMIPKMGMVKMELENGPEWVLVSQAFVKGGISKFATEFTNKTVDYNANLSEFTWILLKLGEKGFINSKQISMVTDVFAHHNEGGFIPIDIDFATVIDISHRKTKEEVANDILSGIKEHIYQIKSKDTPENLNREYSRVFQALLKHKMHPELKQLLLDYRNKYLIK